MTNQNDAKHPRTRHEWARQTNNDPQYGTCIVGVGPVEERARAEEDVNAWRNDGYNVRLVRRPVSEWEPAENSCGCTKPDWYHDGLLSHANGRLCRTCKDREGCLFCRTPGPLAWGRCPSCRNTPASTPPGSQP